MPAQTYLQHEEHLLVRLLVPEALQGQLVLLLPLTRYHPCHLLHPPAPVDLQVQLVLLPPLIR
ncbi:hypothetical protein V4S54_23570, partial [Citrobacter freundii]|uniref:hypothetical protein n=1 Tax=Citrobacter freundii TaxID=546 RepID=UPI002F96CEB0